MARGMVVEAVEPDPDMLAVLRRVCSGVAAMGEAEREERLDRSRAVVARACEATGHATVPLRQEASCVRWRPAAR